MAQGAVAPGVRGTSRLWLRGEGYQQGSGGGAGDCGLDTSRDSGVWVGTRHQS